MNKNAKKWVAALRGGKYGQGQDALRNGDQFCCLGVACDLYMQETGKGKWRKAPELKELTRMTEPYRFTLGGPKNSSAYDLPERVREWLGLRTGVGSLSIETGNELNIPGSTLADANDKGWKFQKIADLIEKYDKELFIYERK